jgi:hypothetical protein
MAERVSGEPAEGEAVGEEEKLEKMMAPPRRHSPILRGLSAAASFHSIRNHVGLPVAVVVAALAAAVAAASAWTDR